MTPKVFAVVPTCRGFKIPEQSIPVEWIIVCDGQRHPVEGKPYLTLITPPPALFGRRCDSIRSAGFLAAYQFGADIILTADDDCFLPDDWAQAHVRGLSQSHSLWADTCPDFPARGTPESAKLRPVAITHGLWSGVPDLGALDQQRLGPSYRWYAPNVWTEIHPPFSQCAMNLGFRREVTPVMYMPFQGPDTPFDRFADIWCGLFAQRVLSLHGYSFSNGGAAVHHTRASNLEANLLKEAPGRACHEDFWTYIWAFSEKRHGLEATYVKLAERVARYEPALPEHKPYFETLSKNMLRWLELLRAT